MGPTMSTKYVPGGSFRAEKQQRLVDDHKPPSSNEAKNKYRYSSVPPYAFTTSSLKPNEISCVGVTELYISWLYYQNFRRSLLSSLKAEVTTSER